MGYCDTVLTVLATVTLFDGFGYCDTVYDCIGHCDTVYDCIGHCDTVLLGFRTVTLFYSVFGL